jgi:hypothetical protein
MKFRQGFRLLVRLPLQAAALGDVSDVALNDIAMIHLIDVADKFNFNLLPGFRFERQVFVADVAFVLQFSEGGLVLLSISEHTYLPELLAYYLSVRVAQHLLNEGIGIEDCTLTFVEDEDGILGRFKQPPIAQFRILKCDFDAPALGDVFEGKEDKAWRALHRLEASGVEQHDLSPDRRKGVLDLDDMDGALVAKDFLQQRPQLRKVPLTLS